MLVFSAIAAGLFAIGILVGKSASDPAAFEILKNNVLQNVTYGFFGLAITTLYLLRREIATSGDSDNAHILFSYDKTAYLNVEGWKDIVRFLKSKKFMEQLRLVEATVEYAQKIVDGDASLRDFFKMIRDGKEKFDKALTRYEDRVAERYREAHGKAMENNPYLSKMLLSDGDEAFKASIRTHEDIQR